MIHFTSDLHLGHDNLIENTRTGFSSTAGHDDALLDALNTQVGRRDTLYILGDFYRRSAASYRQRIKCKNIFFILGNHDRRPVIKRVFGVRNTSSQRMVKIEKGIRAFCCHYPMAYWDRYHHGVWHLYGHIHDNIDYEGIMDLAFPGRRSMDIGVDHAYRMFGSYRPFSQYEIQDLIGNKPGHNQKER